MVASSVAVMVMGDASAGHGLPAKLAKIRELATEAMQERTWSLSDAAALHTVAEAYSAVAAVQALCLGTVRDLDERPDAVAGARPDKTAATFLVHA